MTDTESAREAVRLIRRIFSFRALWSGELQGRLVTELVSLGPPAVRPILEKLEAEPHAFGWRAAALAFALGEIGDREAIPTLVKLLSEGNTPAVVAAAGALERMRAYSALPALCAHLEPPIGWHCRGYGLQVTAAVAEAISTRGTVEHVSLLGVALQKLNPDLRLTTSGDYELGVDAATEVRHRATRRIISGLGRLGDPRAVSYLLNTAVAADHFDSCISAFEQIGSPGIPELVRELRSGTELDRACALCGLVAIGEPAVAALRTRVESRDAIQRSLCAVALACIEGERESSRSLIPGLFRTADTGIPIARLVSRRPDVRQLPGLRSALPHLDALRQDRTIPKDIKMELDTAYSRIESDTAHLRSMPVSSQFELQGPGVLPVPAIGLSVRGLSLPIPNDHNGSISTEETSDCQANLVRKDGGSSWTGS